jgi:hypothetical protein
MEATNEDQQAALPVLPRDVILLVLEALARDVALASLGWMAGQAEVALTAANTTRSTLLQNRTALCSKSLMGLRFASFLRVR